MRYIGNKNKLLQFIESNINKLENIEDFNTLIDVFSGTCAVGEHFKKKFNIISCDILECSYIQSYFKLLINKIPKDIDNYIKKLNDIEGIKGYIFEKYSENGKEGRLYFSEYNGKKIDAILKKILYWENKKINIETIMYLKYSLLEAVSKISNITGVYGSYLKNLQKNATNKILLQKHDIINSNFKHNVFKGESYEKLKNIISNKSILYLDPPYNSRQYSSNYHLLDTIAKNKDPIIKKTRGKVSKSGLPEDLIMSKWCYKKSIEIELKKFLELDSLIIILSYSSESILDKEQILSIMNKYGKTVVHEKQHKKFNSNSVANKNVLEYLFICDKRNQNYNLKSVIQWPGSKKRLIKHISKIIPLEYNNYYELFLGGGSLLFHLKPKTAFCTEINNNLCCMYKNIKNNVEYIIKELTILEQKYLSLEDEKDKNNTKSRSYLYYDIKKKFNSLKINKINKNDNILQTVYFLFLNKTCFNGIYRENSKGEFNVPFGNGKNKTICNKKELLSLANYLNNNNINIINKDFNYYENNIKSKDLVYLDPPYHDTFNGYDKTGWDIKKTNKVIDIFINLSIRGVYVILSNANNDFVGIFKKKIDKTNIKYNILEIEVSRSLNSNINKRKKTKCEVLIYNTLIEDKEKKEQKNEQIIDYNKYNVKDLKKLLKEKGLKGYSRLLKQDLIEMLKK